MNYYLLVCFNLSAIIPTVIALARFRDISEIYYPFLFCLWIGSFNTILDFIFAQNGLPTLTNNNVYVLIESLLLLLLFRRFSVFRNRMWIYYALAALFICVWVAENFIFRTITQSCIYFRILYSLVTVFLSVRTLNGLLTYNDKKLPTNATFILCAAFIFFFSYKILVFAFMIYGNQGSITFLKYLIAILVYVDLITNLLYAVAVIWMPKRVQYSL